MITVAYFTVTTTINDHNISEITPVIVSGVRGFAAAARRPWPKA